MSSSHHAVLSETRQETIQADSGEKISPKGQIDAAVTFKYSDFKINKTATSAHNATGEGGAALQHFFRESYESMASVAISVRTAILVAVFNIRDNNFKRGQEVNHFIFYISLSKQWCVVRTVAFITCTKPAKHLAEIGFLFVMVSFDDFHSKGLTDERH